MRRLLLALYAPIAWWGNQVSESDPLRQSAWERGKTEAAEATRNHPLFGVWVTVIPAVLTAIYAGPNLGLRLLAAAAASLLGYVAVPAAWAGVVAFKAPRRQRDEARKQLESDRDRYQAWMEGQAENNSTMRAERDDARRECAELRRERDALADERDAAIQERDDASARLLVLNDPTRREGLRVALDRMVRRGFELHDEVAVMEPTATDDEGQGIAYDFLPHESKWEQVREFTLEALECIRECDPGLLFTYATGFNAAQEKLRRRNDQLDAAHEKLPADKQMHNMFERIHKRPADRLECVVDALVQVRKEL